jgi:hypothetical protein
MTKETYSSALKYTKMGLVVTPIRPKSKIPLLKQWTTRNKPTINELKKWFLYSDNNIGIRTGQVSNVTVIDIDNSDALNALKALFNGNIPTTFNSKRIEGKGHFFYKYVKELPNKKLASIGIEIKNNGSQVVEYPSIHPEGQQYKWANPNAEIEEMPFELKQKLLLLIKEYEKIVIGKPDPVIKITKISDVKEALPRMKLCIENVYHTNIQLESDNSDASYFRKVVVRDMMKKGIPEKFIIQYFEDSQDNFDKDKTEMKVGELMKEFIKDKQRGKALRTHKCSTIQEKCSSIVKDLCPKCHDAYSYLKRVRRGEDSRVIIKEQNANLFLPIWNETLKIGQQRKPGYFDINPKVLNILFLQSGESNPNKERKRLKRLGLIVSDRKDSTTTRVWDSNKGKMIREVRFDLKAVKHFLKKK